MNRHGLCPSSVYADMVFTTASCYHSRLEPHTPVPAMDVSEMEIFQPLIAKSDSSTQSVLVTAERVPGSGLVEFRFSSQDGSSESKDHAHCKPPRWMVSGWSPLVRDSATAALAGRRSAGTVVNRQSISRDFAAPTGANIRYLGPSGGF